MLHNTDSINEQLNMTALLMICPCTTYEMSFEMA